VAVFRLCYVDPLARLLLSVGAFIIQP
jgi:hypothetical protein